MTPELHNLPHIVSMAFNEPFLFKSAYIRIFFCMLAGRLGITRLTGIVSGVTLGAEQMAEPLTPFGDDEEMGPKPARSYQITDGIAVPPVSGALVSKIRSPQSYLGMAGYSNIIVRLQQAINDPGVDGTLLDMDTPGGMAAGAFDCMDIIARVRDIKPIWVLANDVNCNIGQLIASAVLHRFVTQIARAGSIGVMMAYSSYGAALKTSDVEVTLIHSGDHRVDRNPYEKLPKGVYVNFQAHIDAIRQMFAEKVADCIDMSVQVVLDIETAVFSGQGSVDNGLAEQLVNSTGTLNVMRGAINKRAIISRGGSMKGAATPVDTTQPVVPVNQTMTTVDVPVAVVTDLAVGATVNIGSQATTTVAAKSGYIMGILDCEEVKGHESQARALTETPGMTVESAQRILVAAPLSAQAHTDTALDRPMGTAPGTVTAGSAFAGTGDDLLNTFV